MPDDETGLHRCLDVLQNVLADLAKIKLPVEPADVPKLMQEAPAFMRWGMHPLAELFDDCGLGQKARAVLAAESGAYATPPSRAPVLLHAALMDHYLKGAFYPRGGGQVIPAHLVDVVRSHGGEVRTRAPVERILVEDGRAAGVRLAGGEELRAPVVVSNADLKRTYLEMIGEEHLSPQTVARVKQYRMALPILCVYLGLDIDLRERLPNTNWWYFTSFDIEGMYRDCYEGRVPGDLGLFITAASLKDPHTEAIAPPGCTSLEVMMWAPADHSFWGVEDGPAAGEKYHRNPRYQAMKQRLTEMLVDGAEQVIPGIKEHIVWQEAATPVSQEHFTFSTGGTSYGIELAVDQFGPARPVAEDGDRGAVPGRREHGVRARHRGDAAGRRGHGQRGAGPRPLGARCNRARSSATRRSSRAAAPAGTPGKPAARGLAPPPGRPEGGSYYITRPPSMLIAWPWT